jgi:hypothetical protein
MAGRRIDLHPGAQWERKGSGSWRWRRQGQQQRWRTSRRRTALPQHNLRVSDEEGGERGVGARIVAMWERRGEESREIGSREKWQPHMTMETRHP